MALRLIARNTEQIPDKLRVARTDGWLTPGRTYDALAASCSADGLEYMVKTNSGSAYFFEAERFTVQFPWWPSAWTAEVGNLERFAHGARGLNVLIGYSRMVYCEDHFELLLNDHPTELAHFEDAAREAVGDDALLAIALDLALRLDGTVDELIRALAVSHEYLFARQAIASADPELSKPGLRILDDALALLGVQSDHAGS